MELSTVVVFKRSRDGQDFEVFKNPELVDDKYRSLWGRFKHLGTCLRPVNFVCRHLLNSQFLPIRACRRISSGLLHTVPTNNCVFQYFKGYMINFVKDRHTIPPTFCKSKVDNYECLIDPVDLVRGKVAISIFGYQLGPGYLYVVSLIVGYEKANAQQIIDVVYQTTDSFCSIPQAQKCCIKKLRHICGHHNLPPTAMQIELSDIPSGDANFDGGFAGVYKRFEQGKTLAVKVLRKRSNPNLQKMARRYYKEALTWNFLRHPNVMPLLGVPKDAPRSAFVMISEWMPNGRITSYVKGRLDVNSFKLLASVATGLIYIHGQGIIHGDLKGENILIDGDGNARITDFGLVAILDSTSSCGGGSYRWMSPELFCPDIFGLHKVVQTKPSDCYALAMTIYEVLSGHAPFHLHHTLTVPAKVVMGERPGRPPGAEGHLLTEEIWNLLEHCWKPEPCDRPSVDYVLGCLGKASDSWTPLSSLTVVPRGGDLPGRISLDPSTTGGGSLSVTSN